MGSYFRHFKTICKHKRYVLSECAACGILWRGIVHDLSRFSFAEFGSSARYFQGNRSPIEAEKEAIGYSKAWLHHKAHNKHHWEYWIDFGDNGEVIAYEMPITYVIEMMCDWIGAGKAYSRDKWTQNSPMLYYTKVRKGRYFHPNTEKLLLEFLTCISDQGLDAYHKQAKKILKNYKRGLL